MKLWIDDERPAPEGWTHAKTFHEGLNIVMDHYPEITHIAFDWMLDHRNMAYNGHALIKHLHSEQRYNGVDIFHQPRENYTCHSSDLTMRQDMEHALDEIFCIAKPVVKSVKSVKPKSQLQRLMKAKRR